MPAPQQLTPAYLGSSKAPQSTNPLIAFWRSQVTAPEHRADNLVILRAVTVFAVGVVFVRSGVSSALVPIF